MHMVILTGRRGCGCCHSDSAVMVPACYYYYYGAMWNGDIPIAVKRTGKKQAITHTYILLDALMGCYDGTNERG